MFTLKNVYLNSFMYSNSNNSNVSSWFSVFSFVALSGLKSKS